MPEEKVSPKVIEGLYLHVGNGGATVRIIDSGFGPELEVGTRFFGNCQTVVRIMTTKDGLTQIRDMIDKAIREHEFTPDYCNTAEPRPDVDVKIDRE